MPVTFTIEELQAEIKGLPPDGHFSLGEDIVDRTCAIYYNFVVDKDFRFDADTLFELIDVEVGTSWHQLSSLGSIEDANEEIASGKMTNFRYICITN